jgi:hypothetical protein
MRRMPPPPDAGTTVAVEGTGRAPGASSTGCVSTGCVPRTRERGQGWTWRHGRKWGVVVDVARHCLLAPAAKRGPTNDAATWRPWLDQARHLAPRGCVLADGEFARELPPSCFLHSADHRRAQQHPRQARDKDRAPARHPGADAGHLPRCARYRQRALIESVCSATQRTRAARAAGRSSATQQVHALLLGIAFNGYRLPLRRHFALLMA